MAHLLLRTVYWHQRMLTVGETVARATCRTRPLHSGYHGSLVTLRHIFTSTQRNGTWICLQRTGRAASRVIGRRSSFGIVGKVSLTLVPLAINPFSIFHPKQTQSSELSAEVLANIPKEVFKKDVLGKKKNRYGITKLMLWVWSAVRFWARLCRVLLTFTPLLMTYPLTYLGHGVTMLWWRVLLRAMENLGPTFIKLGQWASTRRDLFSADFCEMFYRLHDSTRTHSWYMTKRKLKKAFGKRWREIFFKVEKKPIGSGCIAQVHQAYMRTDMIPDELLVEECLDDSDSIDDSEIDFAEGLEILGFGKVQDKVDQLLGESDDTDVPLPSGTSEKSSGKMALAGATRTTESSEGDGVPSVSEIEVELEVPEFDEDDVPIIAVAVKVLHPGMFRMVSRDLSILRMLAKAGEWLVPSLRWLSLQECVQEFSVLLTKQIDLRFEADCMDKFGENFEDIPCVRFPRTVRPYCKRDVIVETMEDGEPITNFLYEDIEITEGLKENLAKIGAEALLKMIFVDNLVHGDLHPGNILVQNADMFVSQDENKLLLVDMGDTVMIDIKPVEVPIRLVLLDTGITTSLTEMDRRNFRAVFAAVVMGEGEQAAELMLKHSTYSECKDVQSFKTELGALVNEARSNTVSLGKIDVGQLLSSVFAILSKHKVKMESHFASVILAIFVLEGLGRSLDPQLDLLELAKPFLLS